MKRRNFINLLGAGTVLPFMVGGMKLKAFTQSPFLNALATIPCDDRILVLVQLAGGNDGLNTVIPLDQYANYLAMRPNIAVAETGSAAALKLTNATGLHPQMRGMYNLYNSGMMRVVQNVGYPVPDTSHFRSTDIWMSGSSSESVVETGWLGRWLNSKYPNFPEGYPNQYTPHPIAIQVGNFVSLTSEAPQANMAMAFSNPTTFYNIVNYGSEAQKNTRFLKELDFIRKTGTQILNFATPVKAAAANATNKSTKYAAANAGNSISDQLKIVAQLIAGGLKTRVYLVTHTGYDTHANQLNAGNGTAYSHPSLLAQLSLAIEAFMDDLKLLGVDQKVIGMTFSEFGRRMKQNGSLGTDHGAAAPLFVFGTNVLGGAVLGANPTIPGSVTVNDNIPMQFDFRSVYASILRDWFCVPQADVKTLLMGDFPYLPIINTNTASDVNEDGSAIVRDVVSCTPNPARDDVKINFLSDGTPLRLSLFDHTGRELEVVFEKVLPAGEYSISYTLGSIAAGNYYWRLQSSRRQQTSMMVVLR